jgi:hypothetical protein
MIELDFASFHNQDYSEKGYELYVVKNGSDDILYVGISNQDIWQPWFGWNGHIMWKDDLIIGDSLVGKKIVDHLPESLHWKIQLWALKDCVTFCKDVLPRRSSPTIQFIEPFMIQKLSPILNITYNLNPSKDTTRTSEQEKKREKNLDDWYGKIFNRN